MRLRPPLILAALLAASLSAAAGVSRRWSANERAATPPHASPSSRVEAEASASAEAPSDARAPSIDGAPSDPSGPSRTFRGDRARRNRAAFIGPKAANGQAIYDARGAIEAAPAITKEGDLVVASLSGKVARVTAEGVVRWTADLGDRIYASPLLVGDAVLIGSDAKRFVSLSLANGKTRWQIDVDGEADTAAAEAPDGSVVFAAGRTVHALRADGTIRFRLKLPRKVFGAPAIGADGTIYVGSQDDKLYAITPRGSVRWSRDLGADVDCAAAIGEAGLVFVGTDGGNVVAFDPEGNERWRAAVGGFVRGGLTVTRGGNVLAGTYGPAPRVVSIDGATGRELWSFPVQGTGAAEFGIHGAPVEDPAGNLYFGAHDDRVYALDARGVLRWSFTTGGDVDAPLVIGPGGTLYAGSDDGHLYALR